MRYRLMPFGTLVNKSTPAFDPTYPLCTEVFPLVGSLLVTARLSVDTVHFGLWLFAVFVCLFFVAVFLNHCKYLKVNFREQSSTRPPEIAVVIF